MILVLENEVKPDYRFLGPEIARLVGESEYHVTDSVYADDHGEWFDVELDLIERCIEAEIPLLGDCYGHQLVNHALGGTVESDSRRATFVEMVEYDDSPAGVLEGVNPVVPVLHGDLVVEPGANMESVARTEYNDYFCTRHRSAPVWTVQFHPEFTDRVSEEVSDWDPGAHSFDEVNATRVFENFLRHCESGARAE